MKHLILALSTAGFIVTAAAFDSPPSVSAQSRGTPQASFAEPGISPDATTIAFVSGGDIWEVASGGGDARLLVSHPATESRPLFSPDGTRLAFTSTRSGNGDAYTLTFSTGEITRLTFDDANELVTGWSPDSRAVYFSSTSHDLTGMQDVYRIGIDGGTPMAVAADRYTTEYFAAAAPSGDTLAITARGNAGSQWWRKGHSHLDESQIWIVRIGTPPRYEPVTTGGAKDAWPMWSADGKTLYFMSDRSGAQNIWAQPIGGAAKAVTTFPDGRVLWPSIARDGKTMAFERDFGIWTVDGGSGRAREVPITLRGASAGVGVERRSFTDQIQELALSPDGKKIAFIVRGELFSASAKDGGDAVRLTRDGGGRIRGVLVARQPSPGLFVRAQRHRPPVPLRLRDVERDAADLRHRARSLAAVLARRQADRLRARRPRAAHRGSRHEAGTAGDERHLHDATCQRAARRSTGRRTRSISPSSASARRRFRT